MALLYELLHNVGVHSPRLFDAVFHGLLEDVSTRPKKTPVQITTECDDRDGDVI